jgi:hypothetical protein
MSVTSNKKELEKTLRFYDEFLKTVSEEVFISTPPGGGWSYAKVYSHIINVNYISAIAAEKCLSKVAEIKTRKPDWRVRLILFLGKFPPGKIKAPAVVEAAVKRITKEEAANLLVKTHKKLDALQPQFKNFDSNFKVKHPRLGYLDAKHWLRFMVVHTKHHQNQIIRIERDLAS